MTRNSNFRRFHASLKKMQTKRIIKECGNKESKLLVEDQKYLSKISQKVATALDVEKPKKLSLQDQRADITLKEEISE